MTDSDLYSNAGSMSMRLRDLAEGSGSLCWSVYRRERRVAAIDGSLMPFVIPPTRGEVLRGGCVYLCLKRKSEVHS